MSWLHVNRRWGRCCDFQPLVTVSSHVGEVVSELAMYRRCRERVIAPSFFCLIKSRTARLTQTRASNQVEVSQGCPVDCDTCVWMRVFHDSHNVEFTGDKRTSVHFHVLECSAISITFAHVCVTQQSYTWIHGLMHEVYIFRFPHLPPEQATAYC